jgi:exosortase
MSAATASPPPDLAPAPSLTSQWRGLPFAAQFSAGLLALFVVALSVQLWPEWRHNPDLSHGMFMPLVFLLLLNEARSARAPRWLKPRGPANLALAVLIVGGLLALCAAGLYAAALDWSHALVSFMLTSALALLAAAAIVGFAGEGVRLVPCNWSAFVAAGLWLLCTPIPPGTYTRLTLSLQLWISENVLRTLHVLGIAAERHGNIIDLVHGSVGIEEACSGVRSLISCVFAGLFFSACLVHRPWARALVIGLSVPLALVMNFLRSLALTLLANAGVDIAGLWHDATGFAVLGVTALLLGALALFLERAEKKPGARSAPAPAQLPPPASRLPLRALAASLALAFALLAVFTLNTRSAPHRDRPVPALTTVLPAATPGWLVVNNDLFEFRDTLRTDHLAQRTYVKATPAGEIRIILYLAYWSPGQASVSLVASHTPDACWPGSGWIAEPTTTPRAKLIIDRRPLADAEARLFKFGDAPQYVWFWHLYDGHPINYRDPYSATELLRIALRYGFRHDGDQLFVRVSCNRPWSAIEHEPLIAQFFAHTQALGL